MGEVFQQAVFVSSKVPLIFFILCELTMVILTVCQMSQNTQENSLNQELLYLRNSWKSDILYLAASVVTVIHMKDRMSP